MFWYMSCMQSVKVQGTYEGTNNMSLNKGGKPRRGLDVPIEVAAVHPVHTVVSGETAARRPERWKSKTRPPSRAVTFSVKVVTL